MRRARPMSKEAADRYYRRRTTRRASKRRIRKEWGIIWKLLQPIEPGSLIVDVPCGIGPYSQRLEERGMKVVAGDKSAHMLHYCIQDADPMVSMVADVRSLPIASGVADGVLLVRILHHMWDPADRKAALREAARVSRKPGRIIISFMHSIALAPLWKARPTRHTLTIKELRAEAAECGLKIARLRPRLPFLRRIWFARLERISDG